MRQFRRHKLGSQGIAVGIFVAALGIGPPRAGSSAEARITFISGGTEAEHEMTEWAWSRFEAAGLELPPMSISFHDDKKACSGFIGLYSAQAGEVRICNRGGYETEPRHTMLHELAHAWSFAALTLDDVDRFNSNRGLEYWINEQSPWWQQGAEQIAEIVLWGVQDPGDPFRSVWTHTERCDDLAETFRLVTGGAPLNDSGKFCLS